jgi:Zn-dependent protease
MLVALGFIAVILAITFHEFSHGWVAHYLGDETAARAGRLTLNPIAHIDPVGTLLLPFLLAIAGLPPIGWAKPVPINPNNFNNPRLGSALTAIAGPVSNFLQASLAAILLKLTIGMSNTLYLFLASVVSINLLLMVFNLIPIPPLDGSKFFGYFIPILEDPKFEAYGPVILLLFIFLFHGVQYLLPIVNFIALNILRVGKPF